MSAPSWTELPNVFNNQLSGWNGEMRIGTPIIKSKAEIILPVCRFATEAYKLRLWIYKYNLITHELQEPISNKDSNNIFYKSVLCFSCITDATTNIIYIPSKYGLYK